MRYALAVLLLILLASAAYADDLMFALTYEPSMPLGDTKDFIEEASYRGFGVEIKRFYNPFNPNISFNVSWHLNSFRESVPHGHLTGFVLTDSDNHALERRLVASPILIHADYHFNTLREEAVLVPYIGCGVGGYWIETETQHGDDDPVKDSNWHFGVAPEAGFLMPLGEKRDILLVFAARYNYAFESRGSKFQYLTLALGLGYATR